MTQKVRDHGSTRADSAVGNLFNAFVAFAVFAATAVVLAAALV